MTREEHQARHVELHKMLDELVADWIRHTDRMPSSGSILELMAWSYQQTLSPAEPKE